MNNQLTDRMIEREYLKQFAALTRHSPESLADRFVATFRPEGADVHVALSFGKRVAEAMIPNEARDLSLDDFAKQYAAPAAAILLGSA